MANYSRDCYSHEVSKLSFCLITPMFYLSECFSNGEIVEALLGLIPQNRIDIAVNIFKIEQIRLTTQEMTEALKDAWSTGKTNLKGEERNTRSVLIIFFGELDKKFEFIFWSKRYLTL